MWLPVFIVLSATAAWAENAGEFSANPYDPDSTSNPYGRYSSPLSPDSINNPSDAGNSYRFDSLANPCGRSWGIEGR